MTSNAQCPGYNIPLFQPTRLEALHSRLKGVTPDSTQRRDELRVSEPIHDEHVREARDYWDSSDGEDHQWRHGEVAESSDRGSHDMEVNSLDVGGLLEEYLWCRKTRDWDENDAKNSTGSMKGSSTAQAYLFVVDFGTSGIDDRLQNLGIRYGGTGTVEQRDKAGCGSVAFFPTADRNNCGEESGPLKAATEAKYEPRNIKTL